ncbi:MAG: CcmD family protein [Deltaproteobacteria bacterium]|nr:MAG: CcmD family protein [Deltaproteobacteria bacterium]TMA56094.1 MAG: CcmD family protein [Deltaproteobacteria bacterium]
MDAHRPPRLRAGAHPARGVVHGPARPRRAARGRGGSAQARARRQARGGGVRFLPYLFAAYTAVWIGIFVYLMRLTRRTQELEDEVRDLRHRLRG